MVLRTPPGLVAHDSVEYPGAKRLVACEFLSEEVTAEGIPCQIIIFANSHLADGFRESSLRFQLTPSYI